MNRVITRRQVLGHALSIGAACTVGMGAASSGPTTASVGPGPTKLFWDPRRRAWPARPPGSESLVIFNSTNDSTAPQPRDFELLTGDVWWRHHDSSHVVELGDQSS